MIAVMLVATLTASAQQDPGTWSIIPKVGFNLANVTDSEDADMKFGLVAGAEARYQVIEPLALTFGLLYSMQGCKFDGNISGISYDSTSSLDYINIPILANYYVIPGLAIKAGIQPAINVKHKNKIEYTGHTEEGNIENFNTIDLAIPLGLSYEFGDFIVDARYNLGLTKLVDSKESSSKNSVFQFTFGYKIPF